MVYNVITIKKDKDSPKNQKGLCIMKKYSIYLARNINTNATLDGPDYVYEDYETLEGVFPDMISDFAEWCNFDLVDVDYDYDEKCAICTVINMLTNQEEVWCVYAREIEEETL